MTSPAAGDDGRPDVRLAAAVAADDGSPGRRSEVWAALVGARVFLALEARAVSHEVSPTTGLVQESEATMALMGVGSPSGARALPAFLDGHLVQRWQPRARPVPLTGPQACRTVLDDGAEALLLDPLGAALAIGAPELAELAAGRVPIPGAALSTRLAAVQGDPGEVTADPGFLAALARAVGPEAAVRSAHLLPGPDGPVLGVVVRRTLPPGELVALAERVRARLGPDLPPDGLDLAVLDPESSLADPGTGATRGLEVPLPGRWARRRARAG
ncbi:MAG: uncharacterized protein JWL64_2612 [Frankiales bacterium]|nr:uncharacterized protein [Frankiales bacterium]